VEIATASAMATSSSSPALDLVSSAVSSAKRTIYGLYVPFMAVTFYAVVYAALSSLMLHPYLMVAMVPMGAYQNLQGKVWHDQQKRLVLDNWKKRCREDPPKT